jgi:hypothetical protein
MPKAMLMPNTEIAVVFMLNGRMDVSLPDVAIARAQLSQTLSGFRPGESKAQTIIPNNLARVNKTRMDFAPEGVLPQPKREPARPGGDRWLGIGGAWIGLGAILGWLYRISL